MEEMEFFIQSNSRLIEEILASAEGPSESADQRLVAHAVRLSPKMGCDSECCRILS